MVERYSSYSKSLRGYWENPMAINRFWLNPFCEESFLRRSYQNGMLGVNRSVPPFCSREPIL
jgi:hypothetical protein